MLLRNLTRISSSSRSQMSFLGEMERDRSLTRDCGFNDLEHGHSRTVQEWLDDMLLRGPLSIKAWCLQERYLPMRTVHIFSGPYWVWECGSRLVVSNLHGPLWNTSKFRNKKDSFQTWHRTLSTAEMGGDRMSVLWFWDLVLSHVSDKLPAVSGVASSVQDLLNCRYLAGIWECDLSGLM